MIWQKYGAIQNVRHSGKKGGKFDKRVTKSDVGEGFTAKKSDVIHSKKKHDILRVTFFLNGPYDDVLLCCIFYECICWWCH